MARLKSLSKAKPDLAIDLVERSEEKKYGDWDLVTNLQTLKVKKRPKRPLEGSNRRVCIQRVYYIRFRINISQHVALTLALCHECSRPENRL
ncbi:hypothetical protein EJ02DRAFT_182562 [Clathrospora elynae]|uniref:Uncharacterized protein n=1 Tax=Clathrospora elynae TaxID=706981 RepID=A0A6A5SQJ8_9PLEO|nr:hypothetical protein EJ02DRAFT_182562 [Clathrospora elynae]